MQPRNYSFSLGFPHPIRIRVTPVEVFVQLGMSL